MFCGGDDVPALRTCVGRLAGQDPGCGEWETVARVVMGKGCFAVAMRCRSKIVSPLWGRHVAARWFRTWRFFRPFWVACGAFRAGCPGRAGRFGRGFCGGGMEEPALRGPGGSGRPCDVSRLQDALPGSLRPPGALFCGPCLVPRLAAVCRRTARPAGAGVTGCGGVRRTWRRLIAGYWSATLKIGYICTLLHR